MSRATILCLFIFLGLVVSGEDKFFDGLGDFIDGIGTLVENIDFNFDFGSSGTSTNYRRSQRDHDDGFINTYLWIRVIDSLFSPRYTTCPGGYNCIITDDGIHLPPTLSVIILQRSIIGLSCILLSLIIIFIILDIVKRRPIKGKRIRNMIILWLMGIAACIALFLVFHMAKLLSLGIVAFWPYFWPYFLAVSLLIFVSYTLFWAYKQSGVRIVRQHHD